MTSKYRITLNADEKYYVQERHFGFWFTLRHTGDTVYLYAESSMEAYINSDLKRVNEKLQLKRSKQVIKVINYGK
jgi:hypothetical protein